jgi:hypothetical protein
MRYRKKPIRTPVLLVILVFATPSSPGHAYPRFGGSTGTGGCSTCHNWTKNPYTSPKGYTLKVSLHDLHRGSAYMNTTCDLCHSSGGYKNPYLNSSAGTKSNTGYGCAGCHGRIYSSKPRGPGLRAHHKKKGVTICGSCHTSDPTPRAENVKPPYYGTSDTQVAAPCNDDASTSEDWTGDNKGLDNDGDGLVDKADPDCSGCTKTTCAAQGKNCGSIPDGCGKTLACGTCSAPKTCVAGVCVRLDGGMPPDLAAADLAPRPGPDSGTAPDLTAADLVPQPIPDRGPLPDQSAADLPSESPGAWNPDAGRADTRRPDLQPSGPDGSTLADGARRDATPASPDPAGDDGGCQMHGGRPPLSFPALLLTVLLLAAGRRRAG